MATTARAAPPTMRSPENGEILYRDIRPFDVTYKGHTITVALPGYYPPGDGESVHVGDDMDATDEALRIIKERLGETR
jgi:HTH-type transcriptional regulator/antitoxin MqsA